MKITITDLAKATGFAKSTVSGILNNKSGFAEKTRQKVLEAAKQYGYVPNEVARGLTSKSTKTIGLVIKDITNPFFSKLTKGVQEVADENGYTVFLCSSFEDQKKEMEQIYAMIGRRVDGFIVAPLLEGVNLDYFFDLKQHEIPFVLLGSIPGLKCDYVEFDDYSGSYQVTNFLLESGHRRIGFITGLYTSRASKLRYNAFRDLMRRHGIEIDDKIVFKNAKDVTDGYQIGRNLITMEERPTALICFDDVIAMGVIKAFTDFGLKVPEDLSLVGFDDIDLMIFPLTTVLIPVYEAGKELAKILLERINNSKTKEYKHVVFEEKLILRSSVKKIM